ncbi:MAG: ATP-dependent Clp protease adaptor ClpS [Bacteroidetes bacterium]|nr:ATP-dependent Clp protease adaptor ClpS [Bacteroidota bacterium]
MFNSNTKEEEVLELKENQVNDQFQLVLYNDDVTPFNYVIESLMTVCKHQALQAEQCALIAHTTGRAIVKSGAFKVIAAMHEALELRKIQSDIEPID